MFLSGYFFSGESRWKPGCCHIEMLDLLAGMKNFKVILYRVSCLVLYFTFEKVFCDNWIAYSVFTNGYVRSGISVCYPSFRRTRRLAFKTCSNCKRYLLHTWNDEIQMFVLKWLKHANAFSIFSSPFYIEKDLINLISTWPWKWCDSQ